MRHTYITTLALSSLCLLAACGGGGGGGGHGGGGGGQASGPSADIQFPPQASLTDANTIAVRGTVESPGKVAHLMVRGVPAATTDGWKTWSATVPLVLGSNELEVLMLDAAGTPIGDGESVSVECQDVVLGNCTGAALGFWEDNERAYWLDADRKHLIHIDLPTGMRIAENIHEPAQPGAPRLTNPGEPVFDEGRLSLYVPDGQFIHTINMGTATLTTFPGLGTKVLDIDYLPEEDMLVALGRRFEPSGACVFEVVEVDPLTGDSEVLGSWNRSLGEGIDATRISLEADGTYVDVASTNAVWWMNLSSGEMEPFDTVTLSNISDISRSMDDNWISILDRTEGLFETDLDETKLTPLYSFDDADSPFSSAFTLSPGEVWGEYFVTDNVQDALYRVDSATDTVTLCAGSFIGSGPSPTVLMDETEFQGQRVAVDPTNHCVYSIASDGSRTELAKGGLLVAPVSLLATDDILYVGCDSGSVVTIDPDGNQELVFDNDHDNDNDNLPRLKDLAFAPDDGKLLYLTGEGLLEIDIVTGFVREIGESNGDCNFNQVCVNPELRVAYATSTRAVYMIFLDNGLQVLLAGDDPNYGLAGFGAPVGDPTGLEFDSGTDSLLVAASETSPGNAGSMSIYRLDLADLWRTEVSAKALGQGPLPVKAWSLERDAATGIMYMTGLKEGALYVVDPISGDRVIASR